MAKSGQPTSSIHMTHLAPLVSLFTKLNPYPNCCHKGTVLVHLLVFGVSFLQDVQAEKGTCFDMQSLSVLHLRQHSRDCDVTHSQCTSRQCTRHIVWNQKQILLKDPVLWNGSSPGMQCHIMGWATIFAPRPVISVLVAPGVVFTEWTVGRWCTQLVSNWVTETWLVTACYFAYRKITYFYYLFELEVLSLGYAYCSVANGSRLCPAWTSFSPSGFLLPRLFPPPQDFSSQWLSTTKHLPHSPNHLVSQSHPPPHPPIKWT